MGLLHRMTAIVGCLVLAVGVLGFAPAPELPTPDSAAPAAAAPASAAPGVGETDLFNFEHVGNITLSNIDAEQASRAVDNQGTDIEFFTAPAVVRNAEGQRIGPDGQVLAAADPDHVAARDFAVVGDHSDGIAIIDITDPEDAYVADYITCANPRSDVGVFQWTSDDGTLRTFVASSRESGALCPEAGPETTVSAEDGNPLTSEAGGFSMFEVTDPYQAQAFAGVRVGAGGAHNFMFHPTEPVAYAWNGELGGGEVSSVQIVDMSPHFVDGEDVSAIRSFVGPTTPGSPHDGELSPDGTTMYVASEYAYLIFDNSDPLDPQLTTSFAPNEGTYAHGYFPTPDGSVSITNNESLALGGFFADRSGVCPGEGLGFYDTSVDGVAVGPVGYFVPPVQGQTPDHRACTSHFGRTAPNNQVMTVAWYVLGGRVVDFHDPALPIEIGAATFSVEDSEAAIGGGRTAGTEAWSAKFYKGPYMYVGDQGRGFDVFRWTGPEACGNPFDETYDSACIVEHGAYRLPVDPAPPAQPTTYVGTAYAAQLAATPPARQEDGVRFSCRL